MSQSIGIFKFRAAAVWWVLAVMFLTSSLGGLPTLAAAGTGAGQAGEIRVSQKLSLAVGTLWGSSAGFLRYEELPFPSLNPDLELDGQVVLQLELPHGVGVWLQAVQGEKASAAFGLSRGGWDLSYGPQAASFKQAGLPYARSIEGLRLSFESSRLPLNLEGFSAETKSRLADCVFKGDDSFGPFFLGHKNIVAGSERVLLNGEELKKGTGPGDEDYYLDYEGGFLYFNQIILAHQTVRAFYEYLVDDPGLSSVFRGFTGSYQFGSTAVNAFLLYDHLPLDKSSILKDSGSTLLAYGAKLATERESGARWENTLIITDLDHRHLATEEVSEEIKVEENQLVYSLGRIPVLYQSERVAVISDGREELVRNLDYSLDYHSGKLALMYEPPLGALILVNYTHIGEGEIEKTEARRGAQTLNCFQYVGQCWSINARLDAFFADFVMPRTRQAPQDRFSGGANLEYRLSETWSVLADLNCLGRQAFTLLQPAVGTRCREGGWDIALKLGADLMGIEGKSAADYYLSGSLKRETFADLKLDFKKRLAEAEGLFPDELKASAVGLIGRLPFSLAYSHGDELYLDKIEARLVLPAQGEYTRGAVTVGAQSLYKDGFGDCPRCVFSAAGNFKFNPPSGLYLAARGSISSSRLGAAGTNTYLLHADTGIGLAEKIVIDYQLRLKGGSTAAAGKAAEANGSLGQTVTFAASLTDQANIAVAYRWLNGSRRHPERGLATSRERGFQTSIAGKAGAVEGVLAYDRSSSTAASAANTHQADVRRINCSLSWQKDGLSLLAGFELATYDHWRRRLQIEFIPAYRFAENAQFWLSYRRIASWDLKEKDEMYGAHLIKTGVTFEL